MTADHSPTNTTRINQDMVLAQTKNMFHLVTLRSQSSDPDDTTTYRDCVLIIHCERTLHEILRKRQIFVIPMVRHRGICVILDTCVSNLPPPGCSTLQKGTHIYICRYEEYMYIHSHIHIEWCFSEIKSFSLSIENGFWAWGLNHLVLGRRSIFRTEWMPMLGIKKNRTTLHSESCWCRLLIF